MDSLSVEKGFKHYHEDISSEDTPMQAGIGFVCSKDKMSDDTRDFCGKHALVAAKQHGLYRRLACFTSAAVDDVTSTAAGPLNGTEAIYRNGECIGFVQRAAYGHSVGTNVGYGYVVNNTGGDRFVEQGCGGAEANKVTLAWLKEGQYELELVGQKRVPAVVHVKCVFDPTNARMQGHYENNEG
jgi:sarcosine dehydrogenase